MEVPAPWNLSGRGLILMYRFPEAFIRESCFLPDKWKELKWSGLGYVMLVDYDSSPVGPYKELLFIPGKASIGKAKSGTISKIYVDSIESMVNGRINWGIPKNYADFQWTQDGRKNEIKIGGSDPWFEIVIEHGSIPIPVDTRLIPINLYQELYNNSFQVNLTGKGTGRFSMLKDIKVNPLFFPPIDDLEPLVAFYVDPFQITFPVPIVETINGY
jgi:hypothetical protein